MQKLWQTGSRLLLILAVALTPQLAAAVGVKPLRTDVTVKPGGETEITLQVINDKDTPERVRPSVQVYTKNDENGYPVAEELPAGDARNISDWISFGQKELTLPAKGAVKATIHIKVPASAQPGGHYAAIFYEPILPADSGGSVQINTRVASLLLIQVEGEQKRSGELLKFEMPAANLVGDKAAQFAVRFKNTGNVHVAPTGKIRLFDSKNEQLKQVAEYTDKTGHTRQADEVPVNEAGGNVLPGSERIFLGNWNKNVQPGDYTAKLELTFTGLEKPFTAETKLTIDEDLRVTDLEFVPAANGQPAAFVLNLENKGNFYERPQGKLAIQNAYETTVATLDLPKDMSYVEPGKTATVRLPWIAKVPEGRHTAKLDATYGLQKTPLEASVSFGGSWMWLLWVVLGVAAAGGMGYGAFYFGQRAGGRKHK